MGEEILVKVRNDALSNFLMSVHTQVRQGIKIRNSELNLISYSLNGIRNKE